MSTTAEPSSYEEIGELANQQKASTIIVAADAILLSSQILPLEERLKLLLESNVHEESIETAKGFLGNLRVVNLEDPNVVAKTREYASFLQKHVTGKELAIVDALVAKMELRHVLQQKARQMEMAVHEQTVQQAMLETKTNAIREQLWAHRTHLATCDKKLAELEQFKADIERKISAVHRNRSQQSEYLSKEVSAVEELTQALAKTKSDVKKTTLEAEDQILVINEPCWI